MFLQVTGSVTTRASAQVAGCFAVQMRKLDFLNSVLRIKHALGSVRENIVLLYSPLCVVVCYILTNECTQRLQSATSNNSCNIS